MPRPGGHGGPRGPRGRFGGPRGHRPPPPPPPTMGGFRRGYRRGCGCLGCAIPMAIGVVEMFAGLLAVILLL